MMGYKPGDILFAELTFADGTGSKKRPVVVLSGETYNSRRQELIVAAVTSNISRLLFGDTKITQWEESGLKFPSHATGIVQTITQDGVLRKLGSISHRDFESLKTNLKKTLEF